MHEDPLVSVIIPAYNAERWIRETIRSVQGQSYQNLEIIVVDDGSPDKLADIVQEMAEEDRRIRLIRKKNGGLPAARNTGFAEANGQYVAPLDADDLWRPDKVEKQVQRAQVASQTGQSPGMVYCWSRTVDEKGLIMRPGSKMDVHEGDVFDQLLVENFIGNGSVPILDRKLVLECGGCLEELNGYGCEDWELYLKIAAKAAVCGVPEYLVGYRQLEGSMSKNVGKMLQAHDIMIVSLKHHVERKLSARKCRDGKTGLMIWMLAAQKFWSGDFWSLLRKMFKHDPLFPIRQISLNRMRLLLRSKIIRVVQMAPQDVTGKPF